jgi:hypothetical protein
MDNQPSSPEKTSVLLLSTPRSWSTFISRELHNWYELDIYDEPLRTTFGNPSHPLYHSRIIWADETEQIMQDRDVGEFFDHMGAKKHALLKETNGVFQSSFLRKMLPEYRVYFLRRHIFWVVHSIMKIPYWYKKWSIWERIWIFEDELERKIQAEGDSDSQDNRFSRYKKMYEDAKGVAVRDSVKLTRTIIHFAVQSIEWQRIADETIDYQLCVKEGIDPRLFEFWKKKNYKSDDCCRQEGEYRTHSTKNPSSPYAWLEHFSDEDRQIIRQIVWTDADLVVPIVSPEEKFSQIPALGWVNIPGSSFGMSNRVISQSDFIKFYNWLLDANISSDDIERKLQFRPSETHNFIQSNWSGQQEKYPDRPMTLVSPIIAMAYCLCNGWVLPHPDAYKRQSFSIQEYERLLKTANYWDRFWIKKIWQTEPERWLYDFYGNISELTLNGLETGFFGWSYQDSVHHLDQQVEIPYMYRTTEIWFRMQKSANNEVFSIQWLKSILDRSQSAYDVFVALVKMNRNSL